MSVVVVATIVPKPGRLEEVAAVIASAIPAVHAEDGCELYSLHQGDGTLVMIEKWSSPEALAVHGRGPTLEDLGRQLRDLTAERMQVSLLEPRPVGETGKGAL